MNKVFNNVLQEVTTGLNSVSSNDIEHFANLIGSCEGNIIGLGAGRMGYSLKGFIMRLSHLGKQAYMIGDTSLPRVKENDLILVNSSSGSTQSIYLFAKQAKDCGATIYLVTASPNSQIGKIADHVICYENLTSSQLMKTYHEQLTWLLFDGVSQLLFNIMGHSRAYVEQNHSVLE